MLGRIALVAALAITALTARADQATQPSDPDIHDRVVQAAVFENKLWLRGAPAETGMQASPLVSIDLSNGSRKLEDKNSTVAIFRGKEAFWLVSSPQHAFSGRSQNQVQLVLSKRENGQWKFVAMLALSTDDTVIALTEVASQPAIVTAHDVRIWQGNGWRAVRFAGGTMGWGVTVAAAPADGSALYVGFDRGEWGGGMVRVDLPGGTGTAIERRGKDLCDGDLNSECDPVTGIVPDPANANCVLASGGLAHMGSMWGRILRVCGDKVSVVYKDERIEHYPGGDFAQSVPFFAIAATRDGFWTASFDKVYRFAGDRAVNTFDMPKLQSFGGIWLSRELPGIIVVRTDVNWGMSVSGYTPLIVPLDENSRTP